MNRTLILDIFRDARIVDIDMSHWDRCIRLAVVACEPATQGHDRLPVYIVELRHVTRMLLELQHGDQPPDFGHYQWNVHTVRVAREDGQVHLHLSGSPHMPMLDVVAGDVECNRIDNQLLDARYPGWNRPGSPFIRRGIAEELATARRAR